MIKKQDLDKFDCFDKRRRLTKNMLAKRDKLTMIDALIYQQENSPNPDREYIRDLERRRSEIRTQLAVMSV